MMGSAVDLGASCPGDPRRAPESAVMADWIELAKALAAHPWWTWCPGMLVCWPNGSERVANTYDADPHELLVDLLPRWGAEDDLIRQERAVEILSGAWPDLDDPATVGCLIGLVLGGVENRQDEETVRAIGNCEPTFQVVGPHLGVAVAQWLLERWGPPAEGGDR